MNTECYMFIVLLVPTWVRHCTSDGSHGIKIASAASGAKVKKESINYNGTFIFTAEETEVWSVNTHQVHQSRTRSFISPPAPHHWTLTWLPGFVEGKKEKRKKCLYRIRKKLSVEGITEHNQQPRIVSALETEEHLGTHSLMKRKDIWAGIWWEQSGVLTFGMSREDKEKEMENL